MNNNNNKLQVMEVVKILLPYLLSVADKVPCHDSQLQGSAYYKEIMETENVNRFKDVARMSKETFNLLLQELCEKGLTSTEFVEAGEKLLITMYVLAGNSNRNTQERFQHSGSSISSYVHETIDTIVTLQEKYIKAPSVNTVPVHIRSNTKYYPYFKDCVGALDGTHVSASIPVKEQAPLCTCRGTICQNVLGVCDFNLKFTYVLVGWEGSAHDGQVL